MPLHGRLILKDSEAQSLSELLQRNTSLIALNLIGVYVTTSKFTTILKGLEQNSTLKIFIFPILNLSSLMLVFEAIFKQTLYTSVDIAHHFIDVKTGVFNFSSEVSRRITAKEVCSLQSFLNSHNITELILRGFYFTPEAFTILCDSIRANNSLTFIDLSYIGSFKPDSNTSQNSISDHDFLKLIDALQSKSNIKNVYLNTHPIEDRLGFECLFTVFQLASANKLTANIKFSRHSFDVSRGYIYYAHYLGNRGLVVLLDALKSKVPIKRVKCGQCGSCLEGLVTLFEIRSINKSVIDSGISPHVIDVENGVFQYLPSNCTRITSKEVTSLQSLLKRFSIKELVLTNCSFTDDAITVLCDSLRVNNSLTSVDFCRFDVYNKSFKALADAFAVNTSVVEIYFCYNTISQHTKKYIKRKLNGHINFKYK
ncbi:hypothetical protein GEMRC1_009853 [Eukaryota sp. GEM-RC1]